MELLRFLIQPDGTLGARYTQASPALDPSAPQPGTALAAILEDEQEDLGEDAPDVYAEFARLAQPQPAEQVPRLPLTADFAVEPDGTLTLVRWPRLARPAVIPDEIEGRPVTAIRATAFAATHLEEACFLEFYQSPICYSVFAMRMGRRASTEDLDEGGPTAVRLPKGLTRIGPYAFWRCRSLTSIHIPAGVTELPAGVFGDCTQLASVALPDGLRSIGYLPRPTDQVMPDVGVFAGCHALKALCLPASLEALGAHTFNSSGLVHLTVQDRSTLDWSRRVAVAQTAFDHTAALLWLDKALPDGFVVYRLGLPAARDKILASDPAFGAILRIPADFFRQPVSYFDQLARRSFRLDFSARMALARLEHAGGLSCADRQFYITLLVRYFERAPQFMPASAQKAHTALFDFLQKQPDLTAADLSGMLRTAGALGLPAELLARMMEVRTKRFSTVTGFEDLELD